MQNSLTTGSFVTKREATPADFLRDKRRSFHFNGNVMCGYSPPAEKKKALVEESGRHNEPGATSLNSQATQVAIFSPAAGRSVAHGCPPFSDIQPFDNGLGSEQNQRRAAVLQVFPGIDLFFLNRVDQ